MSDLLSVYEKTFRKNQDAINKNVEKIYNYLSDKSGKENNINEIMEKFASLNFYLIKKKKILYFN